ncbi:MAG: TRAP transporter small permease [Candidatus Methanomethylicaceae archaeon]
MGFTRDKLVRKVGKIYVYLDRVRATLIVAILVFIVTLGTIQIISRYFTVLGLRPFYWGEEAIRLSSLWVYFLAASLATREGAHLSLAFLTGRFFKRGKSVLPRIANLVVIVTLSYVVYIGLIRTLDNVGASLQDLGGISAAWFYAAIPVGFFYLFVEYLLLLLFEEHPFKGTQRKDLGE